MRKEMEKEGRKAGRQGRQAGKAGRKEGGKEERKLPQSFTLNLTEAEMKVCEFIWCGMAVQHRY